MFKTLLEKFKATSDFRNSNFMALFMLPFLITLLVFLAKIVTSFLRWATCLKTAPRFSHAVKPLRTRVPGVDNGGSIGEAIKYNVRTPLNYDATITHPLPIGSLTLFNCQSIKNRNFQLPRLKTTAHRLSK